MKPVNIRSVSFYSGLWFLWSAKLSDSCDTTIKMLRDERHVGMGLNFTLTCEFICVRQFYILRWYRGTQIVSSVSTSQANYTFPLHVTHAGPNDSGEYYCRTEPPVTDSNTVFIRVLDLFVNVSSTALEVLEGETAKLSCMASALNATLFWARGGCEENHMLSPMGR
ncbi:hypothetical protein AAFF_G00068480 [Aldrovandia affinis]|uniref:Ig-like domain-containing protein n=1 Tax=Aldrovandia affinis TaxID=143900 RepID=A0AAD7WE18_9TELE|nr:hypothetical protein AAFF_G00068480 [Aldrovandia affinis]